jgi:hypothetical protein
METPPITVLELPSLDPSPEEPLPSGTSEKHSRIDIIDCFGEFRKLYAYRLGHRYSPYLKDAQEWLHSLQEGDEDYVCSDIFIA